MLGLPNVAQLAKMVASSGAATASVAVSKVRPRTRRARTLVGLAAGVLVVLGVAAPATAVSNSKSVSKRFGYSIVLPGPWYAYYATRPWRNDIPLPHASSTDTFADNDGRKILVASRSIAAQTTLARFTATTVRGACGKAHAFRITSLARAPARAYDFTCNAEREDVICLTALHAGRA